MFKFFLQLFSSTTRNKFALPIKIGLQRHFLTKDNLDLQAKIIPVFEKLIIDGEGIRERIKALKLLNLSKEEATILANYLTFFAANFSASKSWYEIGVKKLIIDCCDDELTCSNCRQFHNKRINSIDALNPDNLPPWTSCTSIGKQGCRCSIRPI